LTQPGADFLLVAGAGDPGLVGEYDRLDAVAEVELAEDVRDVGFGGVRASYSLGSSLRCS
jgi:hypothetical protein